MPPVPGGSGGGEGGLCRRMTAANSSLYTSRHSPWFMLSSPILSIDEL